MSKKLKEMTNEELIADYRNLMAREKTIFKRKERIKKLFPGIGRAIFEGDVKALFDQHPDLHSFQWEQYTDFFNDGEPCTFGVHRWDWCVNDSPSEYDDDDDEEENENEDAPHPSGLTAEELEKLLTKLETVVSKFMDGYSDDDLEDMFGDHVRVTFAETG